MEVLLLLLLLLLLLFFWLTILQGKTNSISLTAWVIFILGLKYSFPHVLLYGMMSLKFKENTI